MGEKSGMFRAAVAVAAMLYANTGLPAETTPEQERLERQKRVLEALQAERQGREKERAQTEQARRDAADKCESAREELIRRQEAAYLYRKGEDGEPVVFSEEERAASTAQAEAAVKKWCQ